MIHSLLLQKLALVLLFGISLQFSGAYGTSGKCGLGPHSNALCIKNPPVNKKVSVYNASYKNGVYGCGADEMKCCTFRVDDGETITALQSQIDSSCVSPS
ncbi:hypothetical protein O181_048364 [Austropuccinia psidii MF-1]|uniref:Uncharacterized protein n=1 Tax=Austropuccinia psidii MF-1 TaxID=1389203 RepID=A0A9Q3DSV8_9BASI|nr:hypothetical protein [Austropuccinia psidii MF-1]